MFTTQFISEYQVGLDDSVREIQKYLNGVRKNHNAQAPRMQRCKLADVAALNFLRQSIRSSDPTFAQT